MKVNNVNNKKIREMTKEGHFLHFTGVTHNQKTMKYFKVLASGCLAIEGRAWGSFFCLPTS